MLSSLCSDWPLNLRDGCLHSHQLDFPQPQNYTKRTGRALFRIIGKYTYNPTIPPQKKPLVELNCADLISPMDVL